MLRVLAHNGLIEGVIVSFTASSLFEATLVVGLAEAVFVVLAKRCRVGVVHSFLIAHLLLRRQHAVVLDNLRTRFFAAKCVLHAGLVFIVLRVAP